MIILKSGRIYFVISLGWYC